VARWAGLEEGLALSEAEQVATMKGISIIGRGHQSSSFCGRFGGLCGSAEIQVERNLTFGNLRRSDRPKHRKHHDGHLKNPALESTRQVGWAVGAVASQPRLRRPPPNRVYKFPSARLSGSHSATSRAAFGDPHLVYLHGLNAGLPDPLRLVDGFPARRLLRGLRHHGAAPRGTLTL
jgi:hypothetical protein